MIFAIGLLNDRFGKNEIIVKSHANRLLSLTLVKPEANLKELRQLRGTCIIHIRSHDTAGSRIK